MTANDSTPPKGQESSGTGIEPKHGALTTPIGRVSGASAAIDLGERRDHDVEITVDGCALDDEPGVVELSIDTPVPVTVGLQVSDARELVDAIETAAGGAEAEL